MKINFKKLHIYSKKLQCKSTAGAKRKRKRLHFKVFTLSVHTHMCEYVLSAGPEVSTQCLFQLVPTAP